MTVAGPGCETPDPAAQRLVARAKTGDLRAFDALVTQYEQRVLRTARWLLGNREDAEDAAQEVLIRLYRYLAKFDERRDLAPWLYRMTVNVCRDTGRKRRRAKAVPLDDARVERVAARDRSDAGARLAEETDILSAGLETLSGKERSALVLRDIEGLSTEEVARVLGSSATTVRSQISRARVKLKRFRDRFVGKDGGM